MEKEIFRFTCWDIEKCEDLIRVSMKDYVHSLREMAGIRKADRHKKLTRIKLNEYQKFTGKLSCLVIGPRPDLS